MVSIFGNGLESSGQQYRKSAIFSLHNTFHDNIIMVKTLYIFIVNKNRFQEIIIMEICKR